MTENSSNYRPKLPERVRKTQNQYVSSLDSPMATQNPSKKVASLQQETSLITQLSSRLKAVENENSQLKQLLQLANQDNVQLTQRLGQAVQSSISDVQVQTEMSQLKQYNKQLQHQIYQMEQFLDKQGLVYVETSARTRDSVVTATSTNDTAGSQFTQQQAQKMIAEKLSEMDSKAFKSPELGLLESRLRIMNIKFQQKEFVTQEGITFQQESKGLPIIFFQDGIFIKRGPFRAYELDVTAQQFVKDIMDGFVPSELQEEFPNGINFDYVLKSERFCEKTVQNFNSLAKMLGDEVPMPQNDITGAELAELRKNYAKVPDYKQQISTVDDKNRMLQPLPLSAIMSKITDKSLISGQIVKKNECELNKTKFVEEIVEGQRTATLRLTSNRDDKLLLKLPFSTDCGRIFVCVAQELALPQGSFQVRRALGDELSAGKTLEEAGLTPNCRLIIVIAE